MWRAFSFAHSESLFSQNVNNGGIIRAAKAPKFKTLDEYNDAIKAQDEMIDVMHQHRWDNASMHTEAEAADAKKLHDTAKEYKNNLEIAKADAMGFGGHAYAKGTGGVSDYDKGMSHAYGNIGDGIQLEQQRKAQAEKNVIIWQQRNPNSTSEDGRGNYKRSYMRLLFFIRFVLLLRSLFFFLFTIISISNVSNGTASIKSSA